MLTKLKALLKASYSIKRPKQKKILIFDRMSIKSGLADKIFKNNEFEVLDIRYENINLYVLFFVLLNTGFKNLKFNYFKYFLEFVSPKIVYTGIDNQLDFFKLKSIYNKATYISDQFAISKNAYAGYKKGIKKDFYWRCKEYLKKSNSKLFADVIFTFGQNNIDDMSKFIDGNYYALGSTKNNFKKFKKKKIKKINKITFICSGKYIETIDDEKKVFKNLLRFGKENNIKINFLGRNNYDEESFYRKTYSMGNWTYLAKTSLNSSYQHLDNSQMIVFTHGTLGFEALSKGIKVAAFYSHFPEKGTYLKYKRKGPFWTNSTSYADFEKIVKKIINYPDKKWSSIVKKYSKEILAYDSENRIKKLIINKIKNKI